MIILISKDDGYFLKTKSIKGIQLVVPTDTFLYAHMIENRARLDAIISSEILGILEQAGGEIAEEQWLPDFNNLLSDKQKEELNWEDPTK